VFGSELAFAVGAALVRGTGAGQPLGLINSPAAVTISKESGQTAATLTSANIVKMWARRFAMGPASNYVWLINQDVSPQLHLLTLGIGTAGVVTYLPPGGLSAKPYATLMGAPVLESEWCSTLGTVGDVILVDLSQYVTINQGGVQSMSSMHVYFLSDQHSFRSTVRMDGSCWQADPLTPFQGTNTQSPIVLLESRI
jgi:HK97 family phage major capsid protein